ncbi:MAG: GAF domain-containing protein [Planctomycetota bacterium]|nr:MAG: GAF domain-containing protein [Planctomycetota bacterium]
MFQFQGSAVPQGLASSSEPETAFLDDEQPGNSTIMSTIDVVATRENLRLEVNTEAKLKALIEISHNLGKAISLEKVLDKILESLFKVFVQADRGFVVLYDPTRDRLIPRAFKSRKEDPSGGPRVSSTIIRRVMAEKKAILSGDVATDSRFLMSQSIVDFPIHSMMCAPLVSSEGKVLGVIQLDTRDPRMRFTAGDLEVLAGAANQAAVAVENAVLHEALMREELLRRELALAHKVQQGFLPADRPELEAYEFYDYYDPAHELGGDYFDYIPLPARRLAIVVSDVSGKGIAAALLMAKLSAETRYCLATEGAPEAAVTRLNKIFCQPQWESRFVTMLVAVLDPVTHRIVLVNAGHPPMIVRRANGELESVGAEIAGLPLGVLPSATYRTTSFEIAPGDAVIFYTDGVPDAMNKKEEFFGRDGIIRSLPTGKASAETIGKRIVQEVHRFVGEQPQSDDICLTVISRREGH